MPTVRMLTHRAGPDIEAASAGQVIEVSDAEAKELIDGGFAEVAVFPPAPVPTAEGPDAEFAKVAAALATLNAESEPKTRTEPQASDKEIQANQAAFDADNATDAAVAHADYYGVDLSTVEGTGRDGRVTKGDVEAAR